MPTAQQASPANLDVAPLSTPVVGRCRKCKSVHRTVKGAMSTTTCACSGLNTYAWKLLRATVVDTVGCDVNCEFAVGATCRCSCGGDRHASGHKN